MEREACMECIPIGVVRSPYRERGDAPRQGRLVDTTAEIHIFEEFAPGLQNVEGSSHLIVLYWLDRAERGLLFATPPGESAQKGVFSTRSPARPNPIGLGIVDLISRSGAVLAVRGLDALDGTPVLDIKPYSPEIDCIPAATGGWRIKREER
ncbi:tRNA (N6-threonylcarbamoyladenosine(37)-N6)-methyltransferase TrmO [Methanoculleus taiwanensis]|nr:tRNA (N6-threonylcarbamoyladenosine(37)-N6)-methyltransferase TrmO [Methanoculleus taiwanensis]